MLTSQSSRLTFRAIQGVVATPSHKGRGSERQSTTSAVKRRDSRQKGRHASFQKDPLKRALYAFLFISEDTAILQWNCRSIRANWGELRKLVAFASSVSVFLQGTMLGASPLPSLQGYLGVATLSPRNGGIRRICAIYTRRDISSS